MMNKIETATVFTPCGRSYETYYKDTYEADHAITEAEAADLIAAKYHCFPITKAEAFIDGNTVAIRYTIDNCD